MKQALERRLAAVMSIDCVGYSKLMGQDEAGTFSRMRDLREDFVQPTLQDFGGRIVKLTGDGALVEFPSCVDAVEAALAIQKGMQRDHSAGPDSERIMFRIGINSGEVIVENGDIYGDGVNIAARIEGIAEPGGVALSGDAWRMVEGKVVAVFEDCGPQALKNITHPVQVYRWPNDTSLPGKVAVQAGTGLKLPDKPAILVLPFENRSREPGDESFVDGITDDVITELSRFSSLFVISRHSSFAYKSRNVTPQDIRRDLGISYIIEGNVRRSADRIRVSVELIDATAGGNIWAGRIDRQFDDIFDVEDELVTAIVAALPDRIFTAERERVKRMKPQDMRAYDYLVAGRLLHHKVTPEDNRRAVAFLDKAIEIDPDFAEAHAWRACTLGQAAHLGFTEDSAVTLKQALASLDRAVSLNESDVECQRLMCEVCIDTARIEQAIAHNQQALAMNPNDPRLVAQRGELLTWEGKAEEAIEWLERAMQLDPYGASKRLHLMGRALYAAGRYADALKNYGRISSPRTEIQAETAAAFARMGDAESARRVVAEVIEQNPKFSVSGYIATRPFLDRQDAEHFSEGMKAAGLPA